MTPKEMMKKITANTATQQQKTAATVAAALLTLGLGLGTAQTAQQTPPQPPSQPLSQQSPSQQTPETTTQSVPLQLPGQLPDQPPGQMQALPGTGLLGAPGSAQLSPYFSYREVEKAAKAIEGATRKAYEFDYARSFALSNAQIDAPQVAFLELAQSLLQEAQEDYSGSQFFRSEKKAKAAEDLYKAAEHIYRAQGAFLATDAGPRGRGPGAGRGRGPSKRAYEAPFKAQEELFKLERESAFYNLGDARVTQLQTLASDLLMDNVAGTNAGLPVNPYGLYSPPPALSYAEAAREVAKAGRHLLEGLRGF